MTASKAKDTTCRTSCRDPESAGNGDRAKRVRSSAKGSEARRRLILDAARRLFIRDGYENVSLRNIAREAGYSPAALYRYFKGKDALLGELRREGCALFHEGQLRTLTIPVPRERLLAQGHQYLLFAREQPEYFELLFGGHRAIPCGKSACDPTLAEAAGNEACTVCGDGPKIFELFSRSVHEAMAVCARPPEDVEAAVFTFWSMVHGLACLTGRGKGLPQCSEDDPRHLLERMCLFVVEPRMATELEKEKKSLATDLLSSDSEPSDANK